MSTSSLPPCSDVPLEKTQTTCCPVPGLESHSGCVKRGSKNHKMGLLTSVSLQATSLHRYYSNFGTGQQCQHSPQAHSRFQASEPRTYEMAFQDADFKADPCANMPRGLVFIGGSGRCLLSYPDNPSSPTVLEICVRRGYQYTVLLFGLSLTPHTFMKCMDAALSLLR